MRMFEVRIFIVGGVVVWIWVEVWVWIGCGRGAEWV